MQKRRMNGFTLAEVLITLGIVAIVASTVIPNWAAKYQRFVFKNQFGKFYSTFSQALVNAYNENGMMAPNCYYILNSDKSTYGWSGNTELCRSEACPLVLKQLKVIKSCYPARCPFNYGNKAFGNNAFSSSFMSGLSNKMYFLSDGSIIFGGVFPLEFAVDLNGKKGPNKWGYDLYIFHTVTDRGNIGSKYYLYPGYIPVEAGGMSGYDMLKSLYTNP